MYFLHAGGTSILKDCIVGPEVDSRYDLGPIHICFVIGPQSKLHKEIGDWRTCGLYIEA